MNFQALALCECLFYIDNYTHGEYNIKYENIRITKKNRAVAESVRKKISYFGENTTTVGEGTEPYTGVCYLHGKDDLGFGGQD